MVAISTADIPTPPPTIAKKHNQTSKKRQVQFNLTVFAPVVEAPKVAAMSAELSACQLPREFPVRHKPSRKIFSKNLKVSVSTISASKFNQSSKESAEVGFGGYIRPKQDGSIEFISAASLSAQVYPYFDEDTVTAPVDSTISASKFNQSSKESAEVGFGGYIRPKQDGSIEFISAASLSAQVYPYFDEDTVTAPVDSDLPMPEGFLDKFSSLFDATKASSLPKSRGPQDCVIDLLPDSEPVHGRVYNLTASEDLAMQKWLEQNLNNQFIRKSSSPFGAPCFFIKKKSGDLRLCMDYRALNKITRKDRNPLPLISDLLRTLGKGKVFTALDLRGAYNLLRIREGDEAKTVFLTKYGQFEFLVMPFGLPNAPAQFQKMMDAFFRDKIGKFVVVYLDDVVVYSQCTGCFGIGARVRQELRDRVSVPGGQEDLLRPNPWRQERWVPVRLLVQAHNAGLALGEASCELQLFGAVFEHILFDAVPNGCRVKWQEWPIR